MLTYADSKRGVRERRGTLMLPPTGRLQVAYCLFKRMCFNVFHMSLKEAVN
jgi:hypothetical protein